MEAIVLEDCTTLGACEERLEQWVNGGILLGEIPLSGDDVRRLADLVAPAIASEPGHLRLVGRQAPSCLACLLVWLGLRGYREGDYWSAVRTALGLPKDANWESRWGRWFLAYLKTRGLPLFDIPGAHTYVGPILMHGGIPDSCLPEFFERVLIPLFRRLPDPTDPAVVCRELAYLREDDGLRSALVRERGALTERARVRRRLLAVQRRAATIYKELEAVWALEEEASGQDHAAHLPRDWASYQEAMVQRKHALKQDLCALWQECEREVALARRLTPQDRRVLSARSTIDAAGEVAQHLRGKVQALQDLARLDVDIEQQITAGAQCILSEPWQPDYGEAVLSLPLDRLREAIRTLDALTAGSAHTRGSAAIINATADDAGLRRQRTLALAVLACGTACVTWGVGAERALPPLVLGGSLLAAAGWAGWSWRRRSMAQAAMTREATEAVESADAAQACARKEVLALLQGLPLRDEHACAPSVALHDALLALRESCARLWRRAGVSRRRLPGTKRRLPGWRGISAWSPWQPQMLPPRCSPRDSRRLSNARSRPKRPAMRWKGGTSAGPLRSSIRWRIWMMSASRLRPRLLPSAGATPPSGHRLSSVPTPRGSVPASCAQPLLAPTAIWRAWSG